MTIESLAGDSAAGKSAIILAVRVVATESAVKSITVSGGRLYVWLKKDRCCGGGIRLVSASVPPPGKEFRLVEGADFEL